MKRHLLMLLVAVMATVMSLEARTIVLEDGFENGIQDSEWTQESVIGDFSWGVESTDDDLSYPATVKEGTHRAYLRNTTGETQGFVTRLISKVMDLRPTKVYMPELTFWYANPRWGADRDTLRVLYRTGSRSAWKQLAEYSSASADWQRVKLELPEVGQTYQIAFEATDNLGRGIVLDDVKLQSAPECTVPYDLTVFSKGAGKVNLHWSASFDADSFEVVISKDTIDPETVTAIEETNPELIAFHGFVNGERDNLDLLLESGAFYLAYVRSMCEEENSAWSSEASKDGPFGFRVRVAKQIPFTENFNYTAPKNRDEDWSWGNNLNNAITPYVNSTTTGNARGNYSPDTTAAVVFAGELNKPSTFIPADRYVYFTTPALSDTLNEDFHISQCQVHFWSTVYTNTGRQYGRSIMVGVMEDPDDITTFKPVDTVSVWGNKTFQENIVDLGSYTGNGTFLAFVSDFDRQNLFFLDNLTVEYRKEVNKVTKISVNPRDTYATITWEGNANTYNVLITNAEVNPNNPSAEAIVDRATVSGNSYVCQTLEADHSWNSPYYVYVQAEGQEWSYRYPFVTIASLRAVPFAYDFEARTTPTRRIGNQSCVIGMGVFGNAGTYPAVNVGTSYGGANCLFMSKRGGADTWITLPMVDNLDSVQVKFYLSSGSNDVAQAHATIGIMSNPMDINTFVPVSSFKLNASGYTRCYANFENYSGPEGVIAIVWDDVRNMTANTINYIDEIVVEELSECVPPTNIELSVEPDAISVMWEASALSDEWEIFLSRTPLSEAQRVHKTKEEIALIGGVVLAETLTWPNPDAKPSFHFDELIPHTNYYMYVRATCDMDWWSEMSFSTPCHEEAFPYKETFENYNVGSQSVGCWQLADYMGVDYPRIYQAGTTSSSNKTLELYSSGTIHRSVAILPKVDGVLSDMMLTFDVKPYSSVQNAVVIVGTMQDITDQNSFVPFDTVYVSGSDFKKARFILSDYNLEYDQLAITSGLGSSLLMSSDIIIDNVELRDPSCIDPYDFVLHDPSPHSIDVTWSGTSEQDAWEIKLLSKSVTIASIKNDTYNHSYDIVGDTVVTGKAFYYANLAASTDYYMYVRALCGDSTWLGVALYTTCEMLDPTKANKETFESYRTGEGNQPDCWTVGSTSSTASTVPYIYTHNKGSKVLYLKQSSCTSWAATPKIQCSSLATTMVTFATGASLSSEYSVFGVMTDPNDLSTFVALDSVKGEGSSADLQIVSYDMSEYAHLIHSEAKYLAWRGRMKTSDYVYLDDVSIVSTACPLPKPSTSDLTTSSVRISSGLRNGEDWVLLVTDHYVSEENLANEAYNVPKDWIVSCDTTNKTSIRINTLQGQTKYYVAAKTLCNDSVSSPWRLTTFVTPCQSFTPEQLGTVTFSEEEGFTTGTGGETQCWMVGSKTDGVSSTYIPYIEATSSNMHNGNNYLKLYDYTSSSSSYVGAYAIMPELNVDDITRYQVNFWGRGYNGTTSTNQVIVGIITDVTDLSTFVAIDTLNLSKNAWDPFSVGFENYYGDYMGDMGKHIMFLSEFGATNYAYISEVSVELIPNCRPISSFTVDSVGESSAVISWKGYQDTYRLLLSNRELYDYEKPSYRYLLDTIVDHSEEVLITGLEAAANYYVYAQGICDGGDSTAISMTYASIRTTCPTEGGAALPFFDDFESYELNDEHPGCWQLLYTGSYTSYFAVKTVSSNGSKAIDVYSTSSRGCYMVVPRVNGNLENLRLTFDGRSYGGSSAAKMYVGVMADVNDVTTFQLLETFDLAGSTEFTHCQMDLNEYELPYDNLVITAGIPDVTPTQHDAYLDNVGLELVATCNSPKLKPISASYNSLEIGITPADKLDTRWELVVIPEAEVALIGNITAYLDNAESIIADNTTVEINNLNSATSYCIYARTLCSDDDISMWTRNPLKVNTQYYYEEAYFFGFENLNSKAPEPWQRSQYSESDNYYIHPALVTGRDSLGAETQSFIYYPHSRQNLTDSIGYSRTENGALLMYANEGYYGSYVIFPSVGVPQDRSFEFKVRPGYHNKSTDRIAYATDGLIEIGTVDNGRGFETYETLASVRISKPSTTTKPANKNNYLYSYYTLDLDAALIADKQIVLHMPKQPSDSAWLFFDDVTMDAPKGFSLVALKKIIADGESALVEWQNIGGPWNLYIETATGTPVQEFMNLSGVTSQVVENLDPQTNYVARLERAEGSTSASKNYVTTDRLAFRTLCHALDLKENGVAWNFDDSYEWEQNDVLGGDVNDSLYLKPSCFQTGITYDKAVNGYQWLVQRKGYEYYGPMTGYSSSRHYESGMDDTHSLRVHTTDANFNSYIVLPELNCGLDTMMIEFYGRCFVNYDRTFGTVANRGKIVDATYLGNAYSHSIVVGTLTDPKDLSTLHIVDTLTYSYTDLTINDNVNDDPKGLHYWDLMQLPLTGSEGKYIVLFQPAAGLMYLDNLSVKPIGSTLFKPTHMHTTNISATSATLNWEVWHADLQTVVVVLNSMGVEVLRDTVSDTQYSLSELEPAMIYKWYVYQTDGTNESPATKPLPFATECVTNTPDYTNGFEPEQGVVAINGQNAYLQTLCWTYGDAAQGTWKSATYDPYNQANTSNYTYSYEGENAVVMRASFSSRATSSYQPYIAMPAMDVTAYDTLQVMFWMRPAYVSARNDSVVNTFTGSSYSKSIIVGTMTDPTDAATFMPLDTVTYDGTLSVSDKASAANNWLFQQMKVELVGATGPYVALMTSSRQKGGTADKTGDYVWIDNISFARKQECKDPVNLTVLQLGATHAELNWNGIDSAGSYLVQVSTDPFFADERHMVFNEEVNSNTCTVKGLEPQTTYVWRVQALCGERWGESSFSQKASFKTSRTPYFYEPFTTTVSTIEWTFSKAHADNVVDVPGAVIARGTDNGSFSRTTVNYGLSGSHYVAPGHSNDYHWMITPNFYLPEDDSVHFSMDIAMTACNSAHLTTGNPATENDMKDDYYFMIIISDDGGATWKSENILAKWQNTNPEGQQLRDIPSDGMKVRYSLAPYAGKNVRIALYREAKTTSATGVAIHVDNIRLAYFTKEVEYASACQFEDIQVGDIILSGEDTKPGIHAYPTCFYVSDADAKKGIKDSVQQLEIEVYPAQETNFADTICEGDTYSNYDFLPKSHTGVYRRKLQTADHGCDSIVTLNLYVIPRAYAEDVEVALCPGESFEWNGQSYNRAGIFRYTTISAAGCDSIETLIVSYADAEDTLFVSSRVAEKDLPFTYENAEHPYIIGQAPIYYAEGTPIGEYKDTVLVQGINCSVVMVHTLTIYRAEGIDQIEEDTNGVRKVLIHDQLYIIVDNEWYNAAGLKVADPRK